MVQPPASAEMEEAFRWIADQAPASAVKWFNGLQVAIQSLESFPERCPLAEESQAFEMEIRQLLYGKRVGAYRILFTINRDAVHVPHVRHVFPRQRGRFREVRRMHSPGNGFHQTRNLSALFFRVVCVFRGLNCRIKVGFVTWKEE